MSNYKLFAGLTKNDQDIIVKLSIMDSKAKLAKVYGVSPRTIGRIIAQGLSEDFEDPNEASTEFKVGDIVACTIDGIYHFTALGVPYKVEYVTPHSIGVTLVDQSKSTSTFNVAKEHFEKVANVSKKIKNTPKVSPVQDEKINLKDINKKLHHFITTVYGLDSIVGVDKKYEGIRVCSDGFNYWVALDVRNHCLLKRFYIYQSELDKLIEEYNISSTKEPIKEMEEVKEVIKHTSTHTEGTFIKVGNSLMVTFEGVQRTISKDHKNFNEVVEKVLEKDFKAALDLMDVSISINKWSKGKITIENGCISYNGTAIHGTLVNRILSMMKEGDEGFERFAKFLVKLMKNPSATSIKQSYDFIKHNDIEINEKGNLVAFKVVKANYLDKHSGTIDNSVGNFVSMDRGEVDDNRDALCSHGLHVCAKSYLTSFYSNGDRIVKVELSPSKIVSVPSDYSGAKLRTCAYKVIEDVTEQFTKDGYLIA